MKPVPLWRRVAGVAILGALLFLIALFTPIYFHNFELRNYADSLTRSVKNRSESDDLLRTQVVEKAHELSLASITADNVHIMRSGNGIRIEVRYGVPVSLPGYTVTLHFYPGAGSR